LPKKEKIQPLQIYQLLPGTNCKVCGCDTCMAFGFGLIAREKTLSDCPDLQTEGYEESLEILSQYFGKSVSVVEDTGLAIETDKCHGCGDCVVVCTKAISYYVQRGRVVQRDDVPPVLGVVDGLIKVIEWSSCKRKMNPPEYCRLCEEKCPFGALELVR